MSLGDAVSSFSNDICRSSLQMYRLMIKVKGTLVVFNLKWYSEENKERKKERKKKGKKKRKKGGREEERGRGKKKEREQ